jgi:hypothetical protein
MNIMSHPTVIELDRLRAGLLDNDPSGREALMAHLATCDGCRQHLNGSRLSRELARHMDADEWTAQALRARRLQALAGHASNARSGISRYSVWGSAAVTALVLVIAGVNFRTLLAPPAREPATMASATDPATAATQDDVYTDLDFYLWLSKQSDAGASNGRS